MKALLLPLFITLHFNLFCQNHTTSFCLDYSIIHTGKFENYEGKTKNIWEHQAFIKAQFPLNGKWSFSTGFGLMNLHYVKFRIFQNIKDQELHILHNYMVIPVGFVYKVGFVDVQPEVGLGYNFSNPSYYYYYEPGKPPDKLDLTSLNPNPANLIVPFFLTLRSEIKIKQFSLLFGLKGFILCSNLYGSNSRHDIGNDYGYGFLIGLKY